MLWQTVNPRKELVIFQVFTSQLDEQKSKRKIGHFLQKYEKDSRIS